MATETSFKDSPYRITPMSPCGALVHGLDLKQDVPGDVIRRLISDVHRHKLLVVKDQGVIPGERQVQITQWFGEVETAGFELHEKAPLREVLRVANDDAEGYREFGTGGFHVDGSFMENPNAYSIYHIINVPTKGATEFVPLDAVLQGLSKENKSRWDRLWLMKGFKNIRGYQDTPGYVCHPLVYPHPVMGTETMCFHLGKTSFFIWDKNSESRKKTSKEETKELLNEINREIHRDNGKLIYRHKWEAGDFIISDNLAVGHFATPETQLPPEEVGLRVMHRTIVKGNIRPKKLNTGNLNRRRTRQCVIL